MNRSSWSPSIPPNNDSHLLRIKSVIKIECLGKLPRWKGLNHVDRLAARNLCLYLSAVSAHVSNPLVPPGKLDDRQTGMEGRPRPLQPRRPSLAPPERLQRAAEVVLRRRPVERPPLARPLLQGQMVGRHRLLQPRR